MGRLLESAKLLYAAGQPYLRTTTLRAVAEQIRGDGRMSADLWEMLQRRTQEEGFGQFDVGSGLFQTYRPYLEDCVVYSPVGSEIEALLPILVSTQDARDLLYLALALMDINSALSEQAYREAIKTGDMIYANNNLGNLLAEQPGREDEAEQAYRAAINVGPPSAYLGLGVLLARQPNRKAEGCEALREAQVRGVAEAAGLLKTLCGD